MHTEKKDQEIVISCENIVARNAIKVVEFQTVPGEISQIFTSKSTPLKNFLINPNNQIHSSFELKKSTLQIF